MGLLVSVLMWGYEQSVAWWHCTIFRYNIKMDLHEMRSREDNTNILSYPIYCVTCGILWDLDVW